MSTDETGVVRQDYYGTKRISAFPETKGPEGEPGYAVTYEDGYRSWSPKATFEAAYQPITAMSFGHAIAALKTGHLVARAGWNGKGMWLKFIRGRDVQIHNNGFGPRNEFDHGYRERVPTFLSWIGMRTADNGFVPWLASQTDMLADDWMIVEAAHP